MCKQIPVWQQGSAERTCAFLLPMANYSQFILNQYQEVGLKAAHISTPKKNAIKKVCQKNAIKKVCRDTFSHPCIQLRQDEDTYILLSYPIRPFRR